MVLSLVQKHFAVSNVAANWHEQMLLQHVVVIHCQHQQAV